MHVLFVIDPLPGLQAYKDTSVAMMRALVARGHSLSVTLQSDLYIDQGVVKTIATGIDLVVDADLHASHWWSERSKQAEYPLHHFDAVLMRKDPPFDMEYFYEPHRVHAYSIPAYRCVIIPKNWRLQNFPNLPHLPW